MSIQTKRCSLKRTLRAPITQSPYADLNYCILKSLSFRRLLQIENVSFFYYPISDYIYSTRPSRSREALVSLFCRWRCDTGIHLYRRTALSVNFWRPLIKYVFRWMCVRISAILRYCSGVLSVIYTLLFGSAECNLYFTVRECGV